jgi:hypothetical protein
MFNQNNHKSLKINMMLVTVTIDSDQIPKKFPGAGTQRK